MLHLKPSSVLQCFTESLHILWEQSTVYPALIEHVRHASFRKELPSPLLSCIAWSHISGTPLKIHTHTDVGQHRHACTLQQHSTAQSIFGTFFHLFLVQWETHILSRLSQGSIVMCIFFRKCGMLQWSGSSLCGRRMSWRCWCGW